MTATERRTVLGSLMVLLAAPLLLGRDVLRRVTAAKDEPRRQLLPRIAPPTHSVKRRG